MGLNVHLGRGPLGRVAGKKASNTDPTYIKKTKTRLYNAKNPCGIENGMENWFVGIWRSPTRILGGTNLELQRQLFRNTEVVVCAVWPWLFFNIVIASVMAGVAAFLRIALLSRVGVARRGARFFRFLGCAAGASNSSCRRAALGNTSPTPRAHCRVHVWASAYFKLGSLRCRLSVFMAGRGYPG